MTAETFDNGYEARRCAVARLDKTSKICDRSLTKTLLTSKVKRTLAKTERDPCDINDRTTNGIVPMFRALADFHDRPFAVFPSKNPAEEQKFAHLVSKGIAYLEKCGTKIDGVVVADDAATDAKMGLLFGVQSATQDTKNWFPHPSDYERKVFSFSDVPRVIWLSFVQQETTPTESNIEIHSLAVRKSAQSRRPIIPDMPEHARKSRPGTSKMRAFD